MKEDKTLITALILLGAILCVVFILGNRAQASELSDTPVTITIPLSELNELIGVQARSYTYISLSLGNNTQIGNAYYEWEDADGIGTTFEVGHLWPVGDGFWLGVNWGHVSQIDKGKPFTSDHESYVDHFGVKLEYRWY